MFLYDKVLNSKTKVKPIPDFQYTVDAVVILIDVVVSCVVAF